VTRLYRTVGGNPLAIELVVGLLRMEVPLEDVLNRIEKKNGSILQRVFEESWNLLNGRQRETLQALSIFMRPALAEAVQAAANLDKVRFEDTLEVLARLYLVKRLTMHEEQESLLTGRRYFLHPYIRDLLETLRREGEEATFYKRLASSYVSYIRDRGGTPEKEDAADVDQLNGELDNILGILEGCWKVGEGRLVIPVAEAMARWLFTESHWDHLEKYGARAADDARKMGEPHAAARILSEIGRTYSYRLDFDRASKIFADALTLAGRDPRDDWAIAYIQHHMGESLMRRKNYSRAKAILQRSLAGFKSIDSRRSMIGVRYRLAMLAFETNRIKEAKKLATEGLEEAIREGWERLQGFNSRLLGDIAVREREFDEARSRYGQAVKTVPRRDMRIQALIELSVARLEHESGNKELAVVKAANALAHFQKLRMPREMEDARRLAEGLPATPAKRQATRKTPRRKQRSARARKS
jgi:tetratricopeptide (TPR) repeat protein